MIHRLRHLLLHTVRNTPLEHFARSAYTAVAQRKEARYHKEMQEIMARVLKEDSNCIDVGAYRGDVLRQMIRFAPSGRIFGFEPVPQNYLYLTRRCGKASIHNLALSDKPGKARFFHALGRPARSGLVRQAYPDPQERVEELIVEVETLDRVIPESIRIDFIKLDVEGAEANVLRGGRQHIGRDHPIIMFEHGLEMASQFDATPEEVYDLLRTQCDLRVSLMDRWLKAESSLSLDEFTRIVRSKEEFCFLAY